MQESEKPEFIRILMGLSTIKPGKEMTADSFQVYWDAMCDWSLADFKVAANHLARTCEFMPNPFHFENLRKAGRQTAGEAWEHVLRYVRTGSYSGYNGPGRIEAPTADAERAVNAIGGYRIIAQSEEAEHGHMLHRFTQSYQEIREAGEVRQSVPQVTAPKTMGAIADLTARMRK